MINQVEILEFFREVQRVISKHGLQKVLSQLRKIQNDFDNTIERDIFDFILTETAKHYNIEINDILNSKINILEHIAQINAIIPSPPASVSEFETLDKGTRSLVYKIMLEKFNTRFETLSNDQKDVLKEYINNITNTTNLKKYVDTKFTSLRESLLKFLPKIEDATIKIKVNETINLINPILESKTLKDDNIVALLQYQELHSELKKIHNAKQ
jgi:hypothetical protein